MGAAVDWVAGKVKGYLEPFGLGLGIVSVLVALIAGYWLGGPWLLAVILAAMALLAWG